MVSVTDIIKKSPHLVVMYDNEQQIYEAKSVSHIVDGDKGYISFIQSNNEKALERFHSFMGTCVIIDYDLLEKVKAMHYSFSLLLSKNPRLSFMKIVKQFFYDRKKKTIHPSAQIGEGVKIGAGTTIHANVVIYDGVQIGKNCKIKAGAVLGGTGFGYEQDDHGEWVNFPHIGSLILGNDVEVGSNTCIDRGTLDDTILHDGVKIDNNVHIAHNVIVGENTLIIANSMIAGSTKIGKNCWIAPMVAINDNLIIGDNVLIGTGSLVVKNIPSNMKAYGSPVTHYAKILDS